MKNEVNGNYAVKSSTLNLTGDVLEVLKTMILIEKSYGVGYLVQLLKGDPETQFRNEKHSQIETFGALERFTPERIKNIIHLMFEMGLITPINSTATMIGISSDGKKFLDSPKEVVVNWRKVTLDQFHYQLRNALRVSRGQSAKNANQPPYMIYSDFAIDRLLRSRPRTYVQLKQVTGITPYIAETYGEKILALIAENNQLRYEDYVAQARLDVKKPTFQQTKKLFLEGKTISEIAKEKNVTESTVKSYLEKLHFFGELNLKPWIEKNLDSKTLYKGAEYFRKVESPRMKDAYETLGLDYETLRFCKLYVSDVSTSYEELAIPA